MSQQRGGVAAVQAVRRQPTATRRHQEAVMVSGRGGVMVMMQTRTAQHAHGGEQAGGRSGQQVGVAPDGGGGRAGHQRHVRVLVGGGQVGEGGLGMTCRVENGGCWCCELHLKTTTFSLKLLRLSECLARTPVLGEGLSLQG